MDQSDQPLAGLWVDFKSLVDLFHHPGKFRVLTKIAAKLPENDLLQQRTANRPQGCFVSCIDRGDQGHQPPTQGAKIVRGRGRFT